MGRGALCSPCHMSIIFVLGTFVICHSSLTEKALCDHITFYMEYPVDYIDRPRLYGDSVTFLVHWSSGEVTEEGVENLIPGSVELLEQYLIEFGEIMTDKLRESTLKCFHDREFKENVYRTIKVFDNRGR